MSLRSRLAPGAQDVVGTIWLAYLIVGGAAVAGYFLVSPAGPGRIARVVIYCAISASAAVAMAWGIHRFRPQPMLPWLLLAASQAVYATGDTTFYVCHYLLGSTAFPAIADVFYLSHYPLVAAGLILLIRRRVPGRDLPGLLDAALLAVVAGLLSWLFLLGPLARSDCTGLVKFAALGYPVMDLAVLVVAVRLILGPGNRPVAFLLLVINLLAIMSADSGYGVAQLRGNYSPGNALDLIWLAGNLALGAAAAHPTMRLLGQRARQHPVGIGPVRFAALAVAALVAPALFFVAYHRGVLRDIPVLAVGCAVLTTLTILRMAGMVADQHRLATTDGLTGLRTRRFAETQLSLETARARRSGGQLGVFVIDIDRFKTINDRYGHPCGDRALIEIASRLRTASRPGDVLARYGGEEFALLVPGATHHELLAVAERVRLQVASRPVSICDQVRVPVTVSVGAASFPANGSTPDELIAVADRALYRAKTGGRNASVIGAPGEAGRDAHAIGVHDGPLIEFLQQMADEVDAWLSPHEHSTAISRWAGEISTEMGHDTRTVRGLELAGRLHDVGKIVIPERILTKPDVLTDEEWSLLRGHPDHGAQLTRLIPGFASVSEIIRQHHERFDGTGYPDRLGGMGIRVEARIIAVCDSWAAMRCDRAYQAALSEDQAREELHRGRGSQFDPDVVDLFLRLHDAARVGDLRRLGALPLSRSTIPGTASPGTASPGITNPGITNPGTANPGTANPGVTNPGAMASPPTMSRVPTQFVPAGQPVTAKVFQNDAS